MANNIWRLIMLCIDDVVIYENRLAVVIDMRHEVAAIQFVKGNVFTVFYSDIVKVGRNVHFKRNNVNIRTK